MDLLPIKLYPFEATRRLFWKGNAMIGKTLCSALIASASLCASTTFGVVVNVTESNAPGNVGTLFDSRGFELDTQRLQGRPKLV